MGPGPCCVGSNILPIQRDVTRPTPSIIARITAPSKAEPAITFGPERTANNAPVRPPEAIEFRGSSWKHEF